MFFSVNHHFWGCLRGDDCRTFACSKKKLKIRANEELKLTYIVKAVIEWKIRDLDWWICQQVRSVSS